MSFWILPEGFSSSTMAGVGVEGVGGICGGKGGSFGGIGAVVGGVIVRDDVVGRGVRAAGMSPPGRGGRPTSAAKSLCVPCGCCGCCVGGAGGMSKPRLSSGGRKLPGPDGRAPPLSASEAGGGVEVGCCGGTDGFLDASSRGAVVPVSFGGIISRATLRRSQALT